MSARFVLGGEEDILPGNRLRTAALLSLPSSLFLPPGFELHLEFSLLDFGLEALSKLRSLKLVDTTIRFFFIFNRGDEIGETWSYTRRCG